MPNRTQKTTIRDVAVSAGVSHQTVSRVINNDKRVSPATWQKVEAAIAKLGYRPNAIARGMALGRSHTFACLSPNLTDYTFASIIEGAAKEAYLHGYSLMIASAPNDDTFTVMIDELVTSGRTEGLIVLNPYADGRHARIPASVPTVFVGTRPREGAIDSVALADEAAGQLATEHLLGLGHQRIALLTGPMEEDCSQDRQVGYCSRLQAAGLKMDASLVRAGDWSAPSGYTAVKHWLEQKIDFTAIFAQNDRMAIGAIHALQEAGLRVPQDVSVVGLDDMPLASYFDPPLTTLRQDTFGIGVAATRLLVQAVENPGAPRQHLSMPVELVVRGSTQRHAE